MEELISVIERPKLKQFFSNRDLLNLMSTLEQFIEVAQVFSDVELCRDPKDNFLLNLALDSKADFLITGDKDLLVLVKIGETSIMNMKDFLESFGTLTQ
jgi:putative PIN family toxin of toxin-antitoxin system